ncbi:MAG TPA: SDR family NAD(P)-dependent oxidoreductase, partial [Blastocatellia bacterium]|nr:SDR family NAD(P)-dependent oxidoreductase [Blastocatellia bacterium]
MRESTMQSQNRRLAIIIALIATIMAFLRNWFREPVLAFDRMTAEDYKREAAGKWFLIVGGTKGIGAGLARALVVNGAKVVVAGRSKNEETPENAEFIQYDASSLKNGIEFANSLKGRKFDTVVFAVGIITRSTLTRTAEGIEEDLAVSYLSRFVIANELIRNGNLEGRKRLYIFGYPGEDTKPIDIDDLNFDKSPSQYSQMPAHLNTVVLNEALSYELARRHPDLRVYGLNPGLIKTAIRDNVHGGDSSFLGRSIETLIGLFNPNVEQYVERSLLALVLAPNLQEKSGISFSRKGEVLDRSKWTS